MATDQHPADSLPFGAAASWNLQGPRLPACNGSTASTAPSQPWSKTSIASTLSSDLNTTGEC